MKIENTELKNSIQKFYNLLNNYPDDHDTTHEFVVFLKSFLRIQSKYLPTIEVMTLIKKHKPVIFSELRRMARNNLMLEILTDLSTDVNTANKTLKEIKN